MQIETTMRHYLTFVRMAIIKKSTKSKYWRGCREKGTLAHCWWECKLVQPLWKPVWRLLKKLKIELPYDQQFHSIIKQKHQFEKIHSSPVFTIYNCQDMEAI